MTRLPFQLPNGRIMDILTMKEFIRISPDTWLYNRNGDRQTRILINASSVEPVNGWSMFGILRPETPASYIARVLASEAQYYNDEGEIQEELRQIRNEYKNLKALGVDYSTAMMVSRTKWVENYLKKVTKTP